VAVLEKKLPWLKYKEQKEVFLEVCDTTLCPCASCGLESWLCRYSYDEIGPTITGLQTCVRETLPAVLLQTKQRLADGKRILENKKAELASQQGPLKCG
jgi:hypothetical protein